MFQGGKGETTGYEGRRDTREGGYGGRKWRRTEGYEKRREHNKEAA